MTRNIFVATERGVPIMWFHLEDVQAFNAYLLADSDRAGFVVSSTTGLKPYEEKV